MRLDGNFCYLEHSILSKISSASKQEGENASKLPGMLSLLVLVTVMMSGVAGTHMELVGTVTWSLVLLLSSWGWTSDCLTLFSLSLLWHLHSCVISSSESWVIWMTN